MRVVEDVVLGNRNKKQAPHSAACASVFFACCCCCFLSSFMYLSMTLTMTSWWAVSSMKELGAFSPPAASTAQPRVRRRRVKATDCARRPLPFVLFCCRGCQQAPTRFRRRPEVDVQAPLLHLPGEDAFVEHGLEWPHLRVKEREAHLADFDRALRLKQQRRHETRRPLRQLYRQLRQVAPMAAWAITVWCRNREYGVENENWLHGWRVRAVPLARCSSPRGAARKGGGGGPSCGESRRPRP